MCGIVGCIGRKHAAPILLDGLQKLEYRGYDSAGIALMDRGKISVFRRKGRVSELLPARSFSGEIGIGHTRWATHGAPSERNAHPHCFGKVCLVHNGILENAAALKKECEARGEVFSSDTDSEVAAHLIDRFLREEDDLLSAVFRASKLLVGSYAFAVLCEGKEEIVCARMRSPLVVASGEEGTFAASDVLAIAAQGRMAYVLEDGEFDCLTKSGISLFDGGPRPIKREFFPLGKEEEAPEKGNFRHFMRKEISEVPEAVFRSIPDLAKIANFNLCEVLCQTKYLHIVACGTAYHSGLCMKFAAEKLARIPTEVFVASEYRYCDPIILPNTLTIAISQSGETADTLAAAELAKKMGSPLVAVTNVARSSLTRIADFVIETHAGREVAVAATKSFNAQLAVLYALSCKLAEGCGFPCPDVSALPVLARETLARSGQVLGWAPYFQGARSVFFLGRGADRCAALEGSLKLKEISYLPSEGYAAGELKHGTLALVDARTPVVAIACDEALADKTMNAVHEVYARGAKVFLITPFEELTRAREVTDSVLIPRCEPAFSPMLSVIPLQMLAYYVSLALGNDPDKPRNLAKSVTVE